MHSCSQLAQDTNQHPHASQGDRHGSGALKLTHQI
jgi:hypothetical protein